MKKTLLILIICLITGFSLFSQGYDYQVGIGYSAHFIPAADVKPSVYPIGYALYGGMGYSINRNLSVGAEYEFSYTWSIDLSNDSSIALQQHLPKAYIRFYSTDNMILTGLLGMDILVPRIDKSSGDIHSGLAMGARLSIGMGYGQYMAIFTEGRTDHRLCFGIQFGDLWYKESEEEFSSRND